MISFRSLSHESRFAHYFPRPKYIRDRIKVIPSVKPRDTKKDVSEILITSNLYNFVCESSIDSNYPFCMVEVNDSLNDLITEKERKGEERER